MKVNRVWRWHYSITLITLVGLAGSAIAWDGSTWTLPYFGSTSDAGADAFQVVNTGGSGGVAIQGTGNYGVYGATNAGNGYGVYGVGASGTTSTGAGVFGTTTSTQVYGVQGYNASEGTG